MRTIKILIGVIILIAVILFFKYYSIIFGNNVKIKDKPSTFIYIPAGSDFYDVMNSLKGNNLLIDTNSFLWVAKRKKYTNKIRAGRYRITNGMSNNKLINLLRSGKQEPVNLVFNNIRTKAELAGRIAMQIEADSMALVSLMDSNAYLQNFSVNSENVTAIFIPNTYQFYWNTNAEKFIERMYKEFNKFWNEKRVNKLKNSNLTKIETIILASIVEQETQKNDEKERLAGVYINRLRRGIRLQADPTVKFALGDFEIKRILKEHLTINSPYNTYKYKGLPPGPICLPSITSIDATLNFEKHNYLYFCAKDDFSGYHVFSKSLKQHNINAQKYQRALNKNRIYK
ncbi:MAG: endolytic transglycosylase MltG [Chlorobi bacterium]|nr:endolytic transglycosylase MltG [Chlorobiota bacterium]